MTRYKIAMAAGLDAANRQMRKEGRSSWTVEDWNLAAKVTNDLLDKQEKSERETI